MGLIKKSLILIKLYLLQVYLTKIALFLKIVRYFKIRQVKKKIICFLAFIETLVIYSKSYCIDFTTIAICVIIALLYFFDTINFKLKLNKATIICLLFILKYLMLANTNPTNGPVEFFLVLFIFRLLINLNEKVFKK